MTPVACLDLNADLGEGFGAWSLTDDDGLLDVVTSANVACGFHAGDPATMRRVCARAVERGVRIGAQVSYRDLAGFGRRFVDAELPDLVADLVYQVGALREFARAAGGEVAYLKPHGALYNAVVHHEGHARAVVEAARTTDLPVLGLPGSRFLALAAEVGLVTATEAFADRGYTAEGTLVPRREPGALLDTDAMVDRAVRLATDGVIVAVDGTELPTVADSLCVHGDSPWAVDTARQVAATLRSAGVSVTADAGRRVLRGPQEADAPR